MVFNATFNNILVISWRPVLLVEETGVPGENHPPFTIRQDIRNFPIISCSTSRYNWLDLFQFLCYLC